MTVRKYLIALAASALVAVGLAMPAAGVSDTPLDQSAELDGQCGSVVLSLTNNTAHTYVWNVQTSDEQNFNVAVPAGETVSEPVTLTPGEGDGWVSYGTVSGPESDYYLKNDTIGLKLCEPQPDEVTPEPPEFTHPKCEDPGSVSIPDVEGITYTGAEDGQELAHGDEVTVTAEAEDGYVLTEGDWTWPFTAIAEGCDGADGEDGQDGADGQDGEDGEDGKDGVSIKVPTEIDTGR